MPTEQNRENRFVNKKLMLESAKMLKEVIEKLPKDLRIKAMKRLAKIIG